MAARPLALQVENRVAVRSREVPKVLLATRSCKEKLPVLNIRFCVQLRFQRFGRKKQPFYRLVAIDSRVRRDGRPLEVRSFCFLSSLCMQRIGRLTTLQKVLHLLGAMADMPCCKRCPGCELKKCVLGRPAAGVL